MRPGRSIAGARDASGERDACPACPSTWANLTAWKQAPYHELGGNTGGPGRGQASQPIGETMRVAVVFGDEELALDVAEDALVGEWHGPAGVGPAEVERLVLEALENPRQYPPLRQA